jgi:hypothetical protein
MSFNANIPTPEACILSTHVLRVADFTAADWPSATGSYALLINYAGDGVTWEPVGSALFEYDGGRDVTVSGTPTTDSLLRYETDWGTHSSGDCSWGATFFPSSAPPSGYRYEYAWSGDVVSDTGDTFAAIDPVASETTATRAVTCTVSLVRESDSAVICSRAFSRSESLECATGWNPPVDENEWGAESSPAANCSGFPPPEDCTPPAPVACFDSLSTLALDAVAVADFPSCTTNLKFQTKTGAGAWTDAQTGIVADTAYTVAATIAPNMKARFVSDDGTAGAEIDLLICECEPLPPDELSPPAIPDAPTLSKTCSPPSVTITSPAFSTATGAHTTSIEIRRRLLQGGDWATVHTFEAEGDWDDDGVAALGEYEYSARACNAAGCSDWSASASISLISETLAVSIVEPQDGSTLHGERLVRVTISGAKNPNELQLFANGLPLPALRKISGTIQSGVFLLNWDTSEALQGETVLRAEATGNDDCKGFDEIIVTLANTPANAILEAEIKMQSVDELMFRNVHLSIERAALSNFALRRYWALCGLRSWRNGESDPLPSPPTTTEESQTQWDTLQKVSLAAQAGCDANALRSERQAYSALPRLVRSGHHVAARLRLFPFETALAWKLAPSTRLVKAREDKTAGTMNVLGTAPASFWQWDGTGATLKKDLSIAGGASVSDAALLDDKIYAVQSGALWVFDCDNGDSGYLLQIHQSDGASEPRPLLFVERVGSAIIAVCSDAGSSPQTQAYKITSGNVTPIWTLDEVVTKTDVLRVNSSTEILGIATGAKLWSGSGLVAPTQTHEFGSDITALDSLRVGLENGEIWSYTGEGWALNATFDDGGAPVQAVTQWQGALDTQRAVAVSENSAQLIEQSAGGDWGAGKLIENPASTPDVVTAILALRRFTVPKANPQNVEEAAAFDDEALLILTGDDGLLIALRRSPLNESKGAVPMSQLDTFALFAGGMKEAVPEV